jgi:hypothetical protein
MPHSSYYGAVYPTIHDLEEYWQDLRQVRSGYEEVKGIRTRKICSSNVEDGLLEHYDFLNAKLEIKVHVY